MDTFPMGSNPKLPLKELRERLQEWVDFDVAAYWLGLSMGMFPPEKGTSWDPEIKWVFWSCNPEGDFLGHMLLGLVELGILERNEDGDQFRWSPNLGSFIPPAE
jgi:hypothetical protein